MDVLDMIREFTDYAWEELGDADKYIHKALSWKECDAHIADRYMEIASQEIGHFEMLCAMASRVLDTHPDNDTAKHVWKWMHENLMDRLAKINAKRSMY